MLLEGTVINGAIVLDGGEKLPEGARVEIVKNSGQAELLQQVWNIVSQCHLR